jgi:hypothetical protein
LILGYHLVDKNQGNRLPDVTVSSSTRTWQVSPKDLNATFSLIEVRLPPEQSRELRLSDSPCSAPSAHLNLRLYYSQSVFWNLFTQNTVSDVTADIVPPTMNYSVLIELEGSRNTQELTQIAVSMVSDQVNVGCDETASRSISWTAPKGTIELGHFVAQWVNLNNVQTQNAQISIIGPSVVTAVGIIRGREKQFFAFGIGNCPGGGHGALQLTGSYRLAVPTAAAFVINRTYTAKPGSNHFKISPEDGASYKNIKVVLQKATCRISSTTLSGAVSGDQRLHLQGDDPRLSVEFNRDEVLISLP